MGITQEIVLDDLFKRHFEEYHTKSRFLSLGENVEEYFSTHAFPNELLIDAANIVKTSSIVGETYEACFNRLNSIALLSYFGKEFLVESFVFLLVSKHLLGMDSQALLKFLEENVIVERNILEKAKRKAFSDTDELHKKSGWDRYFYNICVETSKNSKCFSRVIGSVLVRDKTIIGTGYNGPPRGVPPCDQRWELDKNLIKLYKSRIGHDPMAGELINKCPRQVLGFKSGERIDLCVAGHAEENAIVNSARMGIKTKGAILYMSCGIPCTKCLVKIINAGIEEIIVTKLSFYDESSEYLLECSDLRVRVFDFLEKN
jgi:dCMP deaminase